MIMKSHPKAQSSVQDFKMALTELRQNMHRLTEFLRDCQVTDAHAFVLPAITKAQEKERRKQQVMMRRDGELYRDPPFDVTAHHAESARRLAFQHWQKFYADDDHSTRMVARLPGVLFIQTPEPDTLMALIEQVNANKAYLQEVVQRLSNHPEERHDKVHDAEPGFMLIAAVRQLLTFAPHQESWNEPLSVNSVSFMWDHRYRSTKLTKNEVLERLDSAMENGANQTSLFYGGHPDGFEFFLKQERDIIEGYPKDATFQIRRPLPVLPACVFRYRLESMERTMVQNMVCHSPVLAINCPLPRKIMPLGNYRGRSQVPNSNRKMVIERLYLCEN